MLVVQIDEDLEGVDALHQLVLHAWTQTQGHTGNAKDEGTNSSPQYEQCEDSQRSSKDNQKLMWHDLKQDEEPSSVYSNREKNILEVALKLHLNDPSIDLESRNELDNLFKNEDWESLHRRLISIVDGLDITT